ALAAKLTAQLVAIDDGDVGLKRLTAEAKVARAAYVAAAEGQAAARRKGAARLDRAVAAELAPKVCLAKVGDAETIVFDEVDAGIGGATAAAVGERLRRLAEDVQVLVV